MNLSGTRGRGAVTGFLCAAACLSFATAKGPDPVADPLDRAAQASALAARDVLLGLSAGPDRRILLAAGTRGHILRSTDGGATWAQAQVPVSTTLTSVRMSGKGPALAVGHGLVVLRSVDGGQNWTRQADGRQLSPAFRELAAEAQTSGREKLALKLNRLAEEGADKPLLDVLMLDENNGLAVGAYGVVLRTSDAGQHWQGAFDLLPDDEDRHINAVRKVGDVVWLAGERGLLYRSTDLGQHFSQVETGSKASIFALAGAGETVVAAGLRGTLLLSSDRGVRWRLVSTNSAYSFNAVAPAATAPGKFVLADESGGVWWLDGTSAKALPLPQRARFPIADFHEEAGRPLIVVGLLGVDRLGALAEPGN